MHRSGVRKPRLLSLCPGHLSTVAFCLRKHSVLGSILTTEASVYVSHLSTRVCVIGHTVAKEVHDESSLSGYKA